MGEGWPALIGDGTAQHAGLKAAMATRWCGGEGLGTVTRHNGDSARVARGSARCDNRDGDARGNGTAAMATGERRAA